MIKGGFYRTQALFLHSHVLGSSRVTPHEFTRASEGDSMIATKEGKPSHLKPGSHSLASSLSLLVGNNKNSHAISGPILKDLLPGWQTSLPWSKEKEVFFLQGNIRPAGRVSSSWGHISFPSSTILLFSVQFYFSCQEKSDSTSDSPRSYLCI